MKKSIFLTLIISLFFAANLLAQCDMAKYNRFIAEGNRYYKAQNYTEALNSYNAAMIACKDKMFEVQKKTKKVFARINQLKAKADAEKEKAIKEKERADSLLYVANAALKKAEEMQQKVETAMFDKAVKERNNKWEGWNNRLAYGELKKEAKEILDAIDSLDLSNNALLRLPKEIAHCPNLKHINLLNNSEIDIKQVNAISNALKAEDISTNPLQ